MAEPPSSPKSCFMIAPIGQPTSDTRKRSDQVLKHIVRPVVEGFGYTVNRADDIDHSGQITSQVINRIADDDLIVADLTDLNPNVFYELALRHALKKPFVQIAEIGTILPFDLQNQRTILFDHHDLDSVAEARERISNSIAALEAGSPVETPMSFAVGLQDLRGSTDPEEQGIAQVVETVGRLESMLMKEFRGSRAPATHHQDLQTMRRFIEGLGKQGRLVPSDEIDLSSTGTSKAFDAWLKTLVFSVPSQQKNLFDEEPPF